MDFFDWFSNHIELIIKTIITIILFIPFIKTWKACEDEIKYHNKNLDFQYQTLKENGKKETIASVIKKIITNPLILGVFAGFLCLFIRYLFPVSNDGNKYFTIRQNLA